MTTTTPPTTRSSRGGGIRSACGATRSRTTMVRERGISVVLLLDPPVSPTRPYPILATPSSPPHAPTPHRYRPRGRGRRDVLPRPPPLPSRRGQPVLPAGGRGLPQPLHQAPRRERGEPGETKARHRRRRAPRPGALRRPRRRRRGARRPGFALVARAPPDAPVVRAGPPGPARARRRVRRGRDPRGLGYGDDRGDGRVPDRAVVVRLRAVDPTQAVERRDRVDRLLRRARGGDDEDGTHSRVVDDVVPPDP